ncbi:MAG: hypothetical protein HQK67_11000 [Desulfamplus sp.]|nr:hypothetical protein [Desulfamplus sp.]
MAISCARYLSDSYGFKLNFHPVSYPNGTSLLLWKMDLSSVKINEGSPAKGCLAFTDSLSLKLNCVKYAGSKYGFDMNLFPNPDDPAGIYFEMDLASLHQMD